MKTYELIVKKDAKYGLEKSPYVMGRIIGIVEGSGASIVNSTLQLQVKHPMRFAFEATKKQLGRITRAVEASYPFMVEIKLRES